MIIIENTHISPCITVNIVRMKYFIIQLMKCAAIIYEKKKHTGKCAYVFDSKTVSCINR